MDNLDLCKIKFELECIRVQNGMELVRCDGSTCDDIEKICIARTPQNSFLYFFGDNSLLEKCNDKILKEVFDSDDVARNFVATVELRRELWYSFESTPSIPYPLVTELGDTQDTLDTFAILENGHWLSRAWSVRRNTRSAEIAVETREECRRKGYGSQVVSAWANSQIAKGKIGIYGHRKYNLESKYLAEKTGAVLFADILSLQ